MRREDGKSAPLPYQHVVGWSLSVGRRSVWRMTNAFTVRQEQPSTTLTREQFVARWSEQLRDSSFSEVAAARDAVIEAAWKAYRKEEKNPRMVQAGPQFKHPEAEVPLDWLETHRAIERAQRAQADPNSRTRILIISGSMRTNQTCPSESPKTYRLAQLARVELLADPAVEIDFLDLSVLTGEFGRVIYPCKACASTAMPLCHWPCSCYPNHNKGQVNDWMNELYPRWIAAHGVLMVTPVNWYQVPAGLKAMMDRLVCADGGNPDMTTTDGKDPVKAKQLELAGWPYPRHLAGRTFGVIVHGDTVGVETLRRSLTDWASDLHLLPVDGAQLDRMIGYYEPYATSHEALDADTAIQAETRNVARALLARTQELRTGRCRAASEAISDPRPK